MNLLPRNALYALRKLIKSPLRQRLCVDARDGHSVGAGNRGDRDHRRGRLVRAADNCGLFRPRDAI